MARTYAENKKSILRGAALLALIIITAVSFSTNITKPRLWIDEGKTVELSRNFLDNRTLDIMTAPSQYTGIAPVLQSTGYPVSIPLAIFFKVFGFGPEQARVYMQIWLVLALIAVYFVAKEIFASEEQALLSMLLIGSFASFYDSGRTVVGEIPGFLLLLTGLYYWLNKDDYWKTGLVWGLAVVTKPSVFGLIIPAITLTVSIGKRSQTSKIGPWLRLSEPIKDLSKIALAMLPAAAIWFILMTHGSPVETFRSVAAFYKNPYSSDITANIIHNLAGLYHSTTIIYFSGLSLAILFAWYLKRKEDADTRLYTFTAIYSIFAFIYYLRSPGWLRYILIAELLILFLLPDALLTITAKIKKIPENKKLLTAGAICIILVIVQTIQLFTVADIYYGDDAPRLISYINANFATSSVASLQALEASAFFQTPNRYNMQDFTGMPTLGADNPLASSILPQVLVVKGDALDASSVQIKNTLATHYSPVAKFGLYQVYKLK